MQRKMSIKKKIGFLIKISGMASCAYHLLWHMTTQLQNGICVQCWLPNGNLNNLLLSFLFSDYAKFGDFTLLLERMAKKDKNFC